MEVIYLLKIEAAGNKKGSASKPCLTQAATHKQYAGTKSEIYDDEKFVHQPLKLGPAICHQLMTSVSTQMSNTVNYEQSKRVKTSG